VKRLSRKQRRERDVIENDKNFAETMKHIILAEVWEYERVLKENDKALETLYDYMRKCETIARLAKKAGIMPDMVDQLLSERPEFEEVVIRDTRFMETNDIESHRKLTAKILRNLK